MKHYKIKIINDKQCYLHRIIMEKHLNRKLKSDEIVHHINGDVHNNCLSNLKLTTRSEHMKHHGKGRYLSDEIKEKIRQANTGKKHSKSTIQKQSKVGKEIRPNAKLIPEDIPTIRKMIKDKIPNFVIAFAYGVDARSISGIKHNKYWNWVA